MPLALKDVLCQEGIPTTVGSKILEGWRPPYDATVTARLKAAGVVILGKTNMDEFAMGSSTEHSAYGPSHNPWDLTRVPGGSGGGFERRARLLPGAARDRHRHRRLDPPAGRADRHGRASSRPTAASPATGWWPSPAASTRPVPCARTVMDAALLHEVIAGHDPRDSTSINAPVPPVVEAAKTRDLKGLRVAVVRELQGEGFEAGVEERFAEAVAILTDLGATVTEVSCPHFDYALAAYYLIAPSEASSNLARFDSVRYGLRVGDDGERSLEEVMALTRAQGFGAEVKRRIILGTYALSSGYYDAYYGQAQKVRALITQDFTSGLRAGGRADRADLPDGRVPLGRQARRPAGDVPPGRREHPFQPVRRTGDVHPGRSVRGLAGGPSGDGTDDARRPALPGRRRLRGSAALRRTGSGLGALVTVPYAEALQEFEPVIGLETHVELGTASKMFCGCDTTFGAEPNTHTCPVCLGLPGALPVVNETAIESTIRIGLALHCDIATWCRFARKNYFYPDMPKNFQTSQYDEPLCTDGYLDVQVNGETVRIPIERVHLEEDTGQVAARRRRDRPDPRCLAQPGRLQPRRHPAGRDRHQADHRHRRPCRLRSRRPTSPSCATCCAGSASAT